MPNANMMEQEVLYKKQQLVRDTNSKVHLYTCHEASEIRILL